MRRFLILLLGVPLWGQYYGGGSSGGLAQAAKDPDVCTAGVGTQYFNTTLKAVRTCTSVDPVIWQSQVATSEPAETGPEVFTPLDGTDDAHVWFADAGFVFTPAGNGVAHDGQPHTAKYTQGLTNPFPGKLYQWPVAFAAGATFSTNIWYKFQYTVSGLVTLGAGVSCQIGNSAASDDGGARKWGAANGNLPLAPGKHQIYFLSTSDGNWATTQPFQVLCNAAGPNATGTSFELSGLSLIPVSGPSQAFFKLCGDPATSGGPLTWDATRSCYTSSPTSITIPSIKATSGTRFLCVDASGNLVSQAVACSGT